MYNSFLLQSGCTPHREEKRGKSEPGGEKRGIKSEGRQWEGAVLRAVHLKLALFKTWPTHVYSLCVSNWASQGLGLFLKGIKREHVCSCTVFVILFYKELLSRVCHFQWFFIPFKTCREKYMRKSIAVWHCFFFYLDILLTYSEFSNRRRVYSFISSLCQPNGYLCRLSDRM